MVVYVYHWEAFVFTFGTFNEKSVHIRKRYDGRIKAPDSVPVFSFDIEDLVREL